jgi:hypothetical protein
MIIPEVIENLEFKYLFIKSFKWQDQMMNEAFQGEPTSGRLYRAIWNNQTKNHRLLVGNVELLIEDINSSNPERPYLCDIHEISLDNIIECKLQEEDLDKLNNWIESNNEDIRSLYKPRDPIQQGLIQLGEAMQRQSQQEFNALKKAAEAMKNLLDINAIQFDIIVDFIEFLVKENYSSPSDPTYALSMHYKHGLGINISKALKYIDFYSSDSRRINEDVNDLKIAMAAIITEIDRKISNNLID